jgi:methionine synthase I (cobalamin-dependent)
MRALVTCLMVLLPATGPAFAQGKAVPKTTVTQAVETRYVTALDGFMDGQADVILKETRQGKAVTAAVLDVCYTVKKGSGRM